MMFAQHYSVVYKNIRLDSICVFNLYWRWQEDYEINAVMSFNTVVHKEMLPRLIIPKVFHGAKEFIP